MVLNEFSIERMFPEERRSGFVDDPIIARRNCVDPEHAPPMMIHVPYGKMYRHVCPSCGNTSYIRSNETRMDTLG